ncbi:hypothetical protein OPW32_03745 [Vibrio europaeus]|uniref:hypothetical protein n=1 Tax=Vibrio europaeus TaxID=300876 RepID=UPI002341F41E|nr:hypothetical protein [Vibrio europaeus]MDC5848321.1 hypothetical protein [Vibrio europaeus]
MSICTGDAENINHSNVVGNWISVAAEFFLAAKTEHTSLSLLVATLVGADAFTSCFG